MSRGAVAAGHPETAAAGVWALRQGGNAIDAAVAAVCASIVVESPLTGLGAGGYMLVHRPGESATLLDFFVAAPGLAGTPRRAELLPVEIDFGDTTQVFNIGAPSCGVPGTPAGLAEACRRFGSMPLRELVRPGVGLAREGVRVNRQQAYLIEILFPVLGHEPAGAELYAPGGKVLTEGATFRSDELADALLRLGEEGAEPFYSGEVSERICEYVTEGGGTLAPADLAAYEPIAREPVRVRFRGREVLTNAPPSSGGLLIAFVLGILERIERTDLRSVVAAMDEAQAARTKGFLAGLYTEGFAAGFLADEAIAAAAERCLAILERGGGAGGEDRLGSTTHITAVDREGRCASVTCSNGTGSGLVVPGTGVHVNNMLGEQDLNPFGYHSTPPGARMPSMMSPTIALRDGELELGLGSGGSNRIRSAIVQTILRTIVDGAPAQDAVEASRVHCEEGVVHAEPGIPEEALEALAGNGYDVVRWRSRSLFFGGVHAVAREPLTGALDGGGDPRRGGAVAVA